MPYGIPDDEFATIQRESYESEGLSWCDSCSEYKPTAEIEAHAGICQQCWEEDKEEVPV